MIDDNILGDRLNLFREGKIDEEIKIENLEPKIENIHTFIFKILEIVIIFIRSISYGFAAKTIFSTDWKFVAFLAVGFSIDLIITNISSIFNK